MTSLHSARRIIVLAICFLLTGQSSICVLKANAQSKPSYVATTSIGKNTLHLKKSVDKGASKTKDTNENSARSEAHRLPTIIRPEKYTISVEPDLQTGNFSGRESIAVDVKVPVHQIRLNSLDLSITKSTVLSVMPKQEIACKLQANPKDEQITLNFERSIEPGKYVVSFEFAGLLSQKLRGFYQASYMQADGKRGILAATQMEPTDARRMFPCFDEPDFKAVYQFTAVVDPELSAVSNSEIVSQRIDTERNKKVIEFAPTPKMSTYLVALIVGKLESTSPVVSQGVPIRVWSVSGKSHMGKYAQQVAAKLLSYYDSYFRLPYLGKKLDLIAIPDFEAGAMENVGAITFKEEALLLDEKDATADMRQRVASIIAHEMAHQWFGDLVTMKWWDDIWLNEAFATWMTNKALNHLYPEWHIWDHFGLATSRAMYTDALLSTRPIHFPVNDPDEANEMFDEITYDKGGSILRMIENYVTDWVFKAGINHYLTTHAYGNATTFDFWEAIQKASGQPIVQITKNWVNNPGYPEISASFSHETKHLNLKQERFLFDEGAAKANASWDVPVRVRTMGIKEGTSEERHLERTKLLNVKQQQFAIITPTKMFVANAGGQGYYIVNYQPSDLKAIEAVIETKLVPAERLSILRDQWYLLRANKVSFQQWLDLTVHFKHELYFGPLREEISQFEEFYRLLDDKARASFSKVICDRLLSVKQHLGWNAKPGEADESKVLRGKVLVALGTIGGDSQTISEARLLFNKYVSQPDSIEPELIDTVTSIVAYNGDEHDYETITQLWRNAKTPHDQQHKLMELGSFQKPDLIQKTLQLVLSDDLKKQDGPHLMGKILLSPAGRAPAWQFLKENWNTFIAKWSTFAMPRVIESCESFSTANDEADLRTFLAAHPIPAGTSAAARTLEQVHLNVQFIKRNANDIRQCLNN